MREKVSKKKIRYRKDGFDLDLTYITDRIIALGFPSIGKEALYRNPLTEVVRFFEHYHKDHYKLYNLCAERTYDTTKFHGRVAQYPFYDHNAPPLSLVAECCKDVHEWLTADSNHIVGINCKAGKGRTGLIICSYLLYSGACATTDDALKNYGQKRTKNGKGVTIASQQRYIRYYEECLKSFGGVVPKTPRVDLEKLVITTVPKISGQQYVTVESQNFAICKGEIITPPKKADFYELPVGGNLEGDCKVQLWTKGFGGESRLCHFWFNTGFIPADGIIEFKKETIDIANKDIKQQVFKAGFAITCHFKLANEQLSEIAISVTTTTTTTTTAADLEEQRGRDNKKKENHRSGEERSVGSGGEERRRIARSSSKPRKDDGERSTGKSTVKSVLICSNSKTRIMGSVNGGGGGGSGGGGGTNFYAGLKKDDDENTQVGEAFFGYDKNHYKEIEEKMGAISDDTESGSIVVSQ
eukprot:TRINITY_DN9742_c0_g1_i3.p1 TRINITY_DN9742_c0_g1~~TRINITY_DN9742_c0_g1_i3.p1  ORF type:complete len:494 (-),score=135.54 TRINITY_DN9742_c0_g1_i3:73-1479(-)